LNLLRAARGKLLSSIEIECFHSYKIVYSSRLELTITTFRNRAVRPAKNTSVADQSPNSYGAFYYAG